MSRNLVCAAVICVVSLVQLASCYRILGIFPTPSISHQVVFRGLTLALNKRGHELVILTPDPINDPTLSNYTEIDTKSTYALFAILNYIENRGKFNWLEVVWKIQNSMLHLSEEILNHPDLRRLYKPDSNETFDLMLVETLYWQGLYPLSKRFGVPMIGMASLGLSVNVQYAIGNPILSSHQSLWELGSKVSDSMTFWQRFENFLHIWKFLFFYNTVYIPAQQAIARKYFGDDVPDIREIEKNISLIFVNQQGPISFSRPSVPKVIDICGFHVLKKLNPLPKDLQDTLNAATNGFIYISLGTNAKSCMMPNRTLNEFITACSRLPYTVLWKFENDDLPGKPDNVHIMKWVPQQAVLAHPNLKVFVYQGGLQSTEEAVAHGVPLVGVPIMGDQDMHVNKLVSVGAAVKLELTTMVQNELVEAISTVASDPRYKQRMMALRSLVNDKNHDPLENAVWWTEYVIRHKGAPHLHSSTADEPWYRRGDMDIVAFISSTFSIVLMLTLFTLHRLIARLHSNTDTLHSKQIKIN